VPRVDRKVIIDEIVKRSLEYGVNPALSLAVFYVESGLDPMALNKVTKAAGIAQLMPSTAREYGVTNVFDYRENVRAGVALLRDLIRQHGFDLREVLRRYGGFRTYRTAQRLDEYVKKVVFAWFSVADILVEIVLTKSDLLKLGVQDVRGK